MIRFLFLGFFLVFFGCATQNCRSLKEAELAARKDPPESPEALAKKKETSVGQRVRVYKEDGSLQCDQGEKISLGTMERELSEMRVYSKRSLRLPGMRIQKCGAPTGQCNVYEIDRENLNRAIELGFREWLEGI